MGQPPMGQPQWASLNGPAWSFPPPCHTMGPSAKKPERFSLHRRLLTALLIWAVCIAPRAWAASVLAYAAGDVAECKGAPEKSAAARTARMIPPDAVVFVVGG